MNEFDLPQPEEGPDESVESVLALLGVPVPGTESAAELPETPFDEVADVFFGVELEERLSEIRDYLLSREDTKEDQMEVERLCSIWGLEDIEALTEIYEDRDFRIHALEELLYLTVPMKDAALGPNQPIEIKDLRQVADAYPQKDTRDELRRQTCANLAGIGFDPAVVMTALQSNDEIKPEDFQKMTKQEQQLALMLRKERDERERTDRTIAAIHLLGWLAGEPYMEEFRMDIGKRMVTNRRINTAEAVNTAIRAIDNQAIAQLVMRRKNGKRSQISFNSEAAIRRYNRLVSAKRMCELIGMGKFREIKTG